MPITCIYGLPGKGKTQFSLYYAIYLCNKFQKNLVCNFSINIPNLREYCRLMRYENFLSRLSIPSAPCVFYADMEADNILENILTIPNSIIIIDESGAYIRARGSTSGTPKKFLKDLTQVRHRRQYCLFISQSEKQIDSAIKVLADEIIYCDGISIYDDKIDAPRLQFKLVRRFTPDKYETFASDPRIRSNPIKSYLSANKNWLGIPTAADSFLFTIYDSFGLIHDDVQSQKQEEVKSNLKGRGRVDSLLSASAPLSVFVPYQPIATHILIAPKWLYHLFTKMPSEFLPVYYKLKKLSSKKLFYIDHKKSLHRFTTCVLISLFLTILLNVFSLLIRLI